MREGKREEGEKKGQNRWIVSKDKLNEEGGGRICANRMKNEETREEKRQESGRRFGDVK